MVKLLDNLKPLLAAPEHPLVIALVGNLHARLVPGLPFDASFQPIAYRLTSGIPSPQFVSLVAAHSGGSAWACITTAPEVPMKCQEWHQRGAPEATQLGLKLDYSPGDEYRGAIEVGSITAALPAKSAWK